MKNFKRLGAALIDISIVNGVFTYAAKIIGNFIEFEIQWTEITFMLYATISLTILIVSISLFSTFCYFKFGNSIGKYILNLRIKSTKGPITKKRLFERELYKNLLIYATLGFYFIFCLIYLKLEKPFLHDEKYNTFVK